MAHSLAISKSFLIIGSNIDYVKNITISQFHINIWYFNNKKIFVDNGLMFEIQKQFFDSNNSLNFKVYCLFFSKNQYPESLVNKISSDKTLLQLVFNDPFLRDVNVQRQNSSQNRSITTFIEFVSGRKFLVLDPNFSSFKDNSQFDIKFDLKDIDKNAVKNLFPNNNILIYTRFRYEIDRKRTSNIYIQNHVINYYTYFDLRFNEPRITDINIDNIIHIKKLQIFLISPVKEIVNELGKIRKYVRFLEDNKWQDYIDQLKRTRIKYLVHYWKAELSRDENNKESNAFNILLYLSSEKKELKSLLILIILLLLIIFVVSNWEGIKLISLWIQNRISEAYLWLASITIAIFAFLKSIGIWGNLLWDSVKKTLKKFRDKLNIQ